MFLGMHGMNRVFGGYGTHNPVSEIFCGTNSSFNTCGYNGGMYNITGYGCNYNPTNSMVGWGVANMLLNLGGQIFNKVMADKKEKAEVTVENDIASKEADLKTTNSEITEKLKALGISDEKQLSNVKPAQSFEDAITKAKSHLESLAEPVKPEGDEAKDNTKIRAYNEAMQAYQKAKEDVELAIKAKEDEQKRLNGIVDETNKLITERNRIQSEIKALQQKAQDQINEQIFDNADGRKRQRTDSTTLNEKFVKNSETFSLKPETKVSKEDVRGAIAGFRTATTEAEKKDWKAKFEVLWSQLDYNDRSNDLRSASKIILEYQP